jgi:hypothetical protein
MTQTDPLSETACSLEYRKMDDVQNPRCIYFHKDNDKYLVIRVQGICCLEVLISLTAFNILLVNSLSIPLVKIRESVTASYEQPKPT